MVKGFATVFTCTVVVMGDDQKLTGPGTSKKSKEKKKHTSPYSYCCSTQNTVPGVSYEGQHRVETAVRWLEESDRSVWLSVGAAISIQDKAWCGLGCCSLGRT